jgi:hypothetical protein
MIAGPLRGFYEGVVTQHQVKRLQLKKVYMVCVFF